MPISVNPIHISVIVPVYNNPQDLRECLSALIASSCPDSEIIVVDDGSTDNTSRVAAQMGVCVLQLPKNAGPSAARNYGVRHSRGDILLFVDADVVVMPGAISHVVNVFEAHPDVSAVFGSYDACPRAKGVVSQYRNLLHHYVHQVGNPDASTFWAGCGAIHRSIFEAVGGFDESRFPRPSIEDIELGYRLRYAGYRILLDKALQGTHLKEWTLWSVIHTDIQRRAIPWARLMLESKNIPNDLNVKTPQRVSGLLVMLACLFLLLGIFRFEFFFLSVFTSIAVIFLNREWYRFLLGRRGVLFASACIPLHFLYFLYSTLSYLWVWVTFHLKAAVNHRMAGLGGTR